MKGKCIDRVTSLEGVAIPIKYMFSMVHFSTVSDITLLYGEIKLMAYPNTNVWITQKNDKL